MNEPVVPEPKILARRKAAKQHGVIAHQQLVKLQLTERRIQGMVRRAELIPLHRGVYLVAGSPPSPESALTAALLAAGKKAHASHRTAAAIWEMPGFGLRTPEVTTVVGATPHLQGVELHRTTLGLTPLDVVVHGIWRVTRPALTLLQLGDVADRLAVEEATEFAVLTDLVTPDDLAVVLDRFGGPGVRGSATLRKILADRTESPESKLEWELIRIVRRYCSFQPTIQHWVTTRSGRTYRLDLCVPEIKVDIEGIGRRWHGGKAKTESDRQRRNALVGEGWVVLEYGWADCKRRPKGIGREIEGVVADRMRLAS
jgi:very-short-patch-repair endonuclease